MLSTRKVCSIRPRNIRKFTPEYFGSNEKRPKQQLSGTDARAGVPGYRVPGVQNKGCGKHGAWKTRGVSGKRGVKVENTGYGFFFAKI